MLIRIWMLLLATALVLGTTTTGAHLSTEAEITETAAEDALAEVCTNAPAPPRAMGAIPCPSSQDAMPPSPPVAQIFRPPRLPS